MGHLTGFEPAMDMLSSRVTIYLLKPLAHRYHFGQLLAFVIVETGLFLSIRIKLELANSIIWTRLKA